MFFTKGEMQKIYVKKREQYRGINNSTSQGKSNVSKMKELGSKLLRCIMRRFEWNGLCLASPVTVLVL
jgi:hypothetical protein